MCSNGLKTAGSSLETGFPDVHLAPAVASMGMVAKRLLLM
jgi:hypothetical protein